MASLTTPVVAGLAVGILLIFLLAMAFSGFQRPSRVNTPICSPRTFVPIPTKGKVLHCPARFTSASVIEYGGFAACTEIYKSSTPGIPMIHEYVLKPNSTGYLTMTYDFGSNDLEIPDFITKKMELHKVTPDILDASLTYIPANMTNIRVFAPESNITRINEKMLMVTYTLSAQNVSLSEEGTYLIPIFQTCLGMLLTVGDQPYSGRLPWD